MRVGNVDLFLNLQVFLELNTGIGQRYLAEIPSKTEDLVTNN